MLGFAGGEELVRKHHGRGVHEFAEILLGPGVVVVEASTEFVGIQGEAVLNGIMDGDARLEIPGGVRSARFDGVRWRAECGFFDRGIEGKQREWEIVVSLE